MKKVKLVKKALLPAVIAVFCSLVALTSVSYAWFTLGNTASVEAIDVNVTTAEGLQISADADEWKSILSLDTLQALDTNQFIDEEGEIFPVSSAGNVVAGKLELFDGVKDKDVLTVSEALELAEEGAVNFIAFDLYVKLDTTTDLYLSNTSTVTSDGENNTQSAVRVAFVNLGTAATPEEARELGANVSTNEENKAEIVKIWEPNSKLNANGTSKQAKADYEGVSGIVAKPEEGESNAEYAAVDTFDFADDNETLFAQLAEGITKIRVYIWLEGQDVDCINDISGSNFIVNLEFEIPNTEVE